MGALMVIIVSFLLLHQETHGQDSEDNKNLGESNYKEAVFAYPPGILSERDIPVCSQDTEELIACNVVNKRFFYPPTIERLCRCPDRSECPWEFSDFKVVSKKEGIFKRITDLNTMMVSSRAQMKFCNEVTGLAKKCTKVLNETALRVVTVEPNIRQIYTYCHCPPFKRWMLTSDESREFNNGTIQRILSYSCDRLPRCKSGELCGNVRQDNFSTFFLCSCPVNHLCYPSDMNNIHNVSELMYNGPAIKSYCLKT